MKKVGVVLEVVTTGTAKRLAEIDLQLFEINKQMREARKLGQTDIYANLKQQQIGLRTEANNLNKTLRDQQKTFNSSKFPEDSLIGLTDRYRRLRREIDALSAAQRNSDFGRNLIKQAVDTKLQIDKLGASVGDFRSNVGNYRNSVVSALEQTGLVGGNIRALFGAGGVIAGVGLAIGAVVKGAKALFDINKDISASQAAVQRTTGLSKEQVDALTESLKELDTATTLDGLLQISAIAGQLGVTGVDGVAAFTGSIDKLVVALGDDFGGGADVVAEKVGRLSNVLFGVTTDGELLAQRLLNLGNALNVLAANGSSTAPVITDFAGRISALAIPLGVSQGEILGLSATMEELGVTAERGGTATVKLFSRLTSSSENFAETFAITPAVIKAAGFEAKDFSELVNTDLVSALQLAAAQALNTTDSNTELSNSLKDVGIKGSGELEVFLKLGQANEQLTQNINTATTALGEQDSVLAEVEARNQSLAGASARLGNAFKELFVQAGIENFFAKIINALIPVVNFFGQVLPQIFNRIGTILSPLINAFKSLFDAIFGGVSDFSALKRIGDLLIGTLVFVVDTVSGFISAIASGIKAVREFVEGNKLLSLAFKALKDVISAPFTLLSKLPALLNGIGSAFRQLRDNIKSLDFSKSIGEAFKDGYDRAQLGAIELKKSLSDTEKQVGDTSKAFKEGGESARDFSDIIAAGDDDAAAAIVTIDGLKKRLKELKAELGSAEVGSKRFKEIQAEIKKVTAAIGETSGKVQTFAKGSIAYLNNQLSELKKKLEEATNATLFNQISDQIDATQLKIDEIGAKFQRFRDVQKGLINPLSSIGGSEQDAAAGINTLISTLDLENKTKIAKEQEVQDTLNRMQERARQQLLKNRKETFDKQLEQEENFLKAQRDITQELTDSISDITADFFTGEIKTFEDFLKGTVLAALDAAEKTIQIYALEATAKQIAEKGFVGIATGAILSAVIKAGFTILKNAISGFAEGGEIKTYSGSKIGQSKRISGSGRDTVLIKAFPGELMMNPEQQGRLKQLAGPDIFRRIGIPGFQTGGLIKNTPQIINPNIAVPAAAQNAQIDQSVFTNQAHIIAAEVARQVSAAVEAGIIDANEMSDRRRQLIKDRRA